MVGRRKPSQSVKHVPPATEAKALTSANVHSPVSSKCVTPPNLKYRRNTKASTSSSPAAESSDEEPNKTFSSKTAKANVRLTNKSLASGTSKGIQRLVSNTSSTAQTKNSSSLPSSSESDNKDETSTSKQKTKKQTATESKKSSKARAVAQLGDVNSHNRAAHGQGSHNSESFQSPKTTPPTSLQLSEHETEPHHQQNVTVATVHQPSTSIENRSTEQAQLKPTASLRQQQPLSGSSDETGDDNKNESDSNYYETASSTSESSAPEPIQKPPLIPITKSDNSNAITSSTTNLSEPGANRSQIEVPTSNRPPSASPSHQKQKPQQKMPKGQRKQAPHPPQRQQTQQPQQKERKENAKRRTKRRPTKKANILREIRRLQRTTTLLLAKLPFQRLVREIALDFVTDVNLRFTIGSLEALQETSETYLTQLFEDSYWITMLRQRKTLHPKDMQAVQKIRYAW